MFSVLDSERCNMKYRIAIWAAAGFLVASGWAVYFLVATNDRLIEPIVSALARSTCPVVMLGSHYPVNSLRLLPQMSSRMRSSVW